VEAVVAGQEVRLELIMQLLAQQILAAAVVVAAVMLGVVSKMVKAAAPVLLS
jgi:hypothetical protein